MQGCSVHTRFFDDNCSECKREYSEMKGISNLTNSTSDNTQNKKQSASSTTPKYKEFTEERAKKLYEELLFSILDVLLMKMKLLKKLEVLLENSAVYVEYRSGLGSNKS